MPDKFQFPKDFYWGSATSAHQVEGGNVNDWSEWEKEKAKKLAEDAKTKYARWQQERFPEMFTPENYISNKAADHYNRYEEDFDILKQLNQNAFRFSIEWSRVEPEEGKWNEREIEHYKKVVAALRTRGIEPFITLWHWPFPLWVAKKGGFENKENIQYFSRYAEKMAKTLPDVKFWITLNEPEVYASHSYLKGSWTPQKKNYFAYRKVIRNMVEAHKEAYRAIKKYDQSAKVCVAKHNVYFEAYQNKLINKILKKFIDSWWNEWFLNQIKDFQDIITINNYHHNRINYGFNKNENLKLSDMGWELYPESLACVARELKKYNLPIYITEHGLADADDSRRELFLKESLRYLHKAISEGADIRGYLHWSFLDNFEWDKGFWPRFGLVEVNYKTQERKIRESAKEYAKICKSNELIL